MILIECTESNVPGQWTSVGFTKGAGTQLNEFDSAYFKGAVYYK